MGPQMVLLVNPDVVSIAELAKLVEIRDVLTWSRPDLMPLQQDLTITYAYTILRVA